MNEDREILGAYLTDVSKTNELKENVCIGNYEVVLEVSEKNELKEVPLMNIITVKLYSITKE